MHTKEFPKYIEKSLSSGIADVIARAEGIHTAYGSHEHCDHRIKPFIKETDSKLIIGWEFIDPEKNPFHKSVKFETNNSALCLVCCMTPQQDWVFSMVESELSYLRELAKIYYSIRNLVIKKIYDLES